MKKIVGFSCVILVFFIFLFVLFEYKKDTNLRNNNPFGKKDLHAETIKQLSDPVYKKQITPEQLDKEIKENKSITIYFYQSTCEHCLKVSPIIVSTSKELGIDVKLFNLLEFNSGWKDYNVEGTPTLVHYENGKELDRLIGEQSKEIYEQWLKQWK